MPEELCPAAEHGLRQLLQADLATPRQPPRPKRRSGSSQPKGPKYYPPDALNSGGRRVQRTLLASPASLIAFLNVVGDRRHHTLYYATDDHTRGQCYDPELLLGVAAAFRAALRKNSRSGHPAWVTVEVGHERHYPLHIHVMSRDDAPLPPRIIIYDRAGEVIAIFDREAGRSKMESAYGLAKYLRKVGHTGAKCFDPRFARDDPRQPAGFQAAYLAWSTGKARCAALGLKRMPRRTLGVYVPRLTEAQRTAALDLLLRTTTDAIPVTSISQAEWQRQEVQTLIPLAQGTPQATERVRQSVITLVCAAQDNRNVHKAWQARKRQHRIAKSTVYTHLNHLGWPTVEKILDTVRGLRSPVRQSRLYGALSRSRQRQR